jgi:hypothetical protein
MSVTFDEDRAFVAEPLHRALDQCFVVAAAQVRQRDPRVVACNDMIQRCDTAALARNGSRLEQSPASHSTGFLDAGMRHASSEGQWKCTTWLSSHALSVLRGSST